MTPPTLLIRRENPSRQRTRVRLIEKETLEVFFNLSKHLIESLVKYKPKRVLARLARLIGRREISDYVRRSGFYCK